MKLVLTRADELLLTSRVFLAEEAMTPRLVNAVLPSDELMPYVVKFTHDMISTVSPGSLRETKRQIYSDLYRPVAAALDASYELIDRMVKESDFAEGVAAFVEKRRSSWSKKQTSQGLLERAHKNG